MGILDLLGPLMNAGQLPQQDADRHFDQFARQAPPDMLGQGVAEAFRSDQTPPFPDMVSQMFGRSDPMQRAGLVNQIISALGPAVLAGGAGNILGRVLGGGGGMGAMMGGRQQGYGQQAGYGDQGAAGSFGGQGGLPMGGQQGMPAQGFPGGQMPQLTPEQAAQLSPEDVRELAAQAEQRDPSIMDHVGQFYARNPQLVKVLGGVAMAIMAGKMAERMRGR